MLVKEVTKNKCAENSLRFLWTMVEDGTSKKAALIVNPDNIPLIQTHGLTRSTAGNIVIPCPYIQVIYHLLDLSPEYCGRIYLRKIDNGNDNENDNENGNGNGNENDNDNDNGNPSGNKIGALAMYELVRV